MILEIANSESMVSAFNGWVAHKHGEPGNSYAEATITTQIWHGAPAVADAKQDSFESEVFPFILTFYVAAQNAKLQFGPSRCRV
jgi:hypothetical protein